MSLRTINWPVAAQAYSTRYYCPVTWLLRRTGQTSISNHGPWICKPGQPRSLRTSSTSWAIPRPEIWECEVASGVIHLAIIVLELLVDDADGWLDQVAPYMVPIW